MEELEGPTRRDELLSIPYVSLPVETPLLVAQVLEAEFGNAPLSITHQDGQRTVTVLAKNHGRTVGEIIADLEPTLIEMKSRMGSRLRLQICRRIGNPRRNFCFSRKNGDRRFVFNFCCVSHSIWFFYSTIYYHVGNSFCPHRYISSVSFILQIPISFPSVIGIIALTGIVVNDAIVMIETMNSVISSKGFIR